MPEIVDKSAKSQTNPVAESATIAELETPPLINMTMPEPLTVVTKSGSVSEKIGAKLRQLDLMTAA